MSVEKIDFSKNYRIESIPSKEHGELAKRGIGVYPGSTFTYAAKYDYVLGRYKNTGLDEKAPEVIALEPKKREEMQKWILDQRKELENLIGIDGYLDVSKDQGWNSELCMVTVEVGQDLKIRVNGHDNILRPMENHKDKIALFILFNNANFPKSKHELGDPQYRNAKFYLTTDGEVSEITKGKIQKTRKAHTLMNELFGQEKNAKKAWEVAFYMGLVKKQSVTAEELEISLDTAIFSDTTGETLNKFIEACELGNDGLLVYNMFMKGINTGIVRITPDGYYHRGHVNYRKSIEESISMLLSVDMQVELASLREEIMKKSKKQNALA